MLKVEDIVAWWCVVPLLREEIKALPWDIGFMFLSECGAAIFVFNGFGLQRCSVVICVGILRWNISGIIITFLLYFKTKALVRRIRTTWLRKLQILQALSLAHTTHIIIRIGSVLVVCVTPFLSRMVGLILKCVDHAHILIIIGHTGWLWNLRV